MAEKWLDFRVARGALGVESGSADAQEEESDGYYGSRQIGKVPGA